jgi:hypothetical protein
MASINGEEFGSSIFPGVANYEIGTINELMFIHINIHVYVIGKSKPKTIA